MREIETIGGQKLKTGCIGCSIASGDFAQAGKVYRSELFDVHQDVEISLPGFVIMSTIRHITSVREFTGDEQLEFSQIVPRIRQAQYKCGLQNVYLFQNEDTADHFHLWMFPIYDWMRPFGKGATLLARAMVELKQGRGPHRTEDVFRMVVSLRTLLQAYDKCHR